MNRLLLLIGLLLFSAGVQAAIDVKSWPQNAPFIVGGSGVSFSLRADRFQRGTAADPNINDIEIRDVVSLRLIDGALINRKIDYTVNLQVTYYTDPFSAGIQQNVSLTVTYEPGRGTHYKGLDTYAFTGAYQVDVLVLSQQANNNTLLPDDNALQLCSRITINRRYMNFDVTAPVGPFLSVNSGIKSAAMTWSNVTGAEEYDVEWTSINNGNAAFATVSQNYTSPGGIATATLDQVFRNNSSRLTTQGNDCKVSMITTDPLFLIRIRAVRYLQNGLREAGNWDYTLNGGTTYNITATSWNDPNLNWQYSAAFAEEGKKKEVISYFDGSLRGRQTQAINSSDNVLMAQENVYDEFGRPVVSILPAPDMNSITAYLHFIGDFNGIQTSSSGILGGSTGANCELLPNTIGNLKGASRYYSASNLWKNISGGNYYKPYNAYIPNAGGYPFSVTQYTPDNTGRIKLQGGVGTQFQPGTGTASAPSHTTKYYYGKPEQWELDQLFGNDVGYAEHYLKNMVVDPNGQISISYQNASGKTIATALAGDAPASLEALDSQAANSVNNSPANGGGTAKQRIHLLKPDQFTYDATALKLTAHTTYLADVIDPTAQLSFDIQKLVDCYPNTATFAPCASCFYKMTVQVHNECGGPVGNPYTADVQLGSATTPGSITVPIDQPGEYYVDIEFAFDRDDIRIKTNSYISAGIANGYIKSQFDYIKTNFLDGLDVSGCYSDCHTCRILLANSKLPDFEQMVKDKCIAMGLDPVAVNSTAFHTWIGQKYGDLQNKCTTLQNGCTISPCDAVEKTMKDDVSPGGQYALFDASNLPLEMGINVLYLHFNDVFRNPALPHAITEPVTRDDGTTVSVYDASFTLQDAVKYWNPAWAVYFLPYHPEHCKLEFCHQESDSKGWDLLLQQYNNKASDLTTLGLTWSPANADDWLLNIDPFFNGSGAGAGAIRGEMLADLQQYSVRVLNLPLAGTPNKTLMAYVDYMLYCRDSNNPSSWTGCAPDAGCRVADREWTTYRDYYLALKAKYYKARQDAKCDGECPVGQPIVNSTGNPNALSIRNFVVSAGSGICGTGLKSVQVAYNGVAPLTDSYIISLQYPSGSNIVGGLPTSITLTSATPVYSFCVPTDMPINNIYIVNAQNSNSGEIISRDHGTYVYITDGPDVVIGSPYGYTRAVKAYLKKDGLLVNAPNDIWIYGLYHGYGSTTYPGAFVIREGTSFASYYYAGRAGTQGVLTCVTIEGGTIDPLSNWLCDPPPPPSCPAEYAYKKSRFPDVQNGNYVTGATTLAAATVLQTQTANDAKAQAADFCAGNADRWLAALNDGLVNVGYSQVDIGNLRTRLIEVCAAGGDISHPMGASDLTGVTPPPSSMYTSFGAAIKGELTLTAFTMQLNPWLLQTPGPYLSKPQRVSQTVNNSNAGICSLLGTLTTQAGGTANLLNYLTTKFGSAMTLTQDDLDVLNKSCTSCNFIMDHEVTLPVFLDPSVTILNASLGIPGVITMQDYMTAKAQLSADFGNNLDANHLNYPEVLSNYMNQTFGFSLTADMYQTFEALGPNSTALLANLTPYRQVATDPNACARSAFETAISNGLNAYAVYIAEERLKFRTSYINTCSAAKAYADLETSQKVYHYTLYYYDQADNLVRTVPPEGVRLLSGPALDLVTLNRQAATTAGTCTYDGTRVRLSDQPGALGKLENALNAGSATAIEMWLYNNTGGINQFTEVTPGKNWLFSVAIQNNVLALDMYPMIQAADQLSVKVIPASLHYRVTIPPASLPLLDFTHLVIQGTNGIAQGTTPQIWLNGVQMTVAAANSPLASWRVKATATGIQYPDIMPTLKHIRFYNRVLDASPGGEIAQDAANMCFMPIATANYDTDNLWYRFNVPLTAGCPTCVAGSTDETRLQQDTYPDHQLKTTYVYNSTKQVTKQQSPDGGINRFWYDLLSRLVISQNDKQLPGNQFSYTEYDQLGRINEVGQKTGVSSLITGTAATATQPAIPPVIDSSNPGYVGDGSMTIWNTSTLGKAQITHTWYDAPAPVVPGFANGIANLTQENLRKRVAASTYTENYLDPVTNALAPATQATYYSYDIDGNVKTLWQQIAGLSNASNNYTLKRLDYEFDLVSGKVNLVRYQDHPVDATHPAQPDRFYYKYDYDAENRIINAWSGTQAMYDSYSNTNRLLEDNRRLDAHYAYYYHGPLARLELGDELTKVQGIDYAYTLQGWLKGVNGTALNSSGAIKSDMYGDGSLVNGVANTIPKDAYAYSLGYFNGDYSPISSSNAPAFGFQYQANSGDLTGQDLYNGNIRSSTMAISTLTSGGNLGATVGYSYHYDQLNRLKTVLQNSAVTANGWNNNALAVQPPTSAYAETFSYDANGNIKDAYRNGDQGNMDDLHYKYIRDATSGRLTTNNMLNYVVDNASGTTYSTDIKTQTQTNNYRYDAIGNLVQDYAEGLGNDPSTPGVDWTVYGKIQAIHKYDKSTRAHLSDITYAYNTAGQRVSKTAGNTTTYYVRDAQGNTMGVYEVTGSTITWKEQDLYGSSRLGQWQPNLDLANNNADAQWQNWGLKQYELNNHLGNNMATISDRRIQVANGTNIDHYEADVINAQDYYAFGMQQPGRNGSLVYDASTQQYNWQAGAGSYRYGFNGKENDNEVKKDANGNDLIGGQQDYGMRIYDPRIGKFLSVDPLYKNYPWYTSYQFAGNSPIKFIDMDGGEPMDPMDQWTKSTGTKSFGDYYKDNNKEFKANLLHVADHETNQYYWVMVHTFANGGTNEQWYNSKSGRWEHFIPTDHFNPDRWQVPYHLVLSEDYTYIGLQREINIMKPMLNFAEGTATITANLSLAGLGAIGGISASGSLAKSTLPQYGVKFATSLANQYISSSDGFKTMDFIGLASDTFLGGGASAAVNGVVNWKPFATDGNFSLLGYNKSLQRSLFDAAGSYLSGKLGEGLGEKLGLGDKLVLPTVTTGLGNAVVNGFSDTIDKK